MQGQNEGGTAQMWSGGERGLELSSPDVAGMGAGAPCGRRGHPDVAGVGTYERPDVRQGVGIGPDVAGTGGGAARLESGVVQMWPGWRRCPLFSRDHPDVSGAEPPHPQMWSREGRPARVGGA